MPSGHSSLNPDGHLLGHSACICSKVVPQNLLSGSPFSLTPNPSVLQIRSLPVMSKHVVPMNPHSSSEPSGHFFGQFSTKCIQSLPHQSMSGSTGSLMPTPSSEHDISSSLMLKQIMSTPFSSWPHSSFVPVGHCLGQCSVKCLYDLPHHSFPSDAANSSFLMQASERKHCSPSPHSSSVPPLHCLASSVPQRSTMSSMSFPHHFIFPKF